MRPFSGIKKTSNEMTYDDFRRFSYVETLRFTDEIPHQETLIKQHGWAGLFILFLSVLKDDTIYFDGIWTTKTHKDYNLRNKWNSFCMSIDFVDDQWNLYINGQTNMTYTYRKTRKLKERFSNRTDLPMVIRLGHYYFDNKPVLGTILDFHVWDR